MILVTGARGFVGQALCSTLQARGLPVVGLGRSPSFDSGLPWVQADLLDRTHDWQNSLRSVTHIVHCAARAHVMREDHGDPLAAYREANVQATLQLAEQALAAGVKRFIYISSIKVNGESTPPGLPFTASSPARPEDAYGESKWETESCLRALAAKSDMEIVVIRPPLVYGPGVKGNFLMLLRLMQRGWPLPLGAIHNARSLLALENLVDLMICCLEHSAAAGQTFLVSDGEDVSTSELLAKMARSMNHAPRLLPVPVRLLRTAGRVVGKSAQVARLCDNLQVDIGHTQARLQWQPRVSLDEGLRVTAQWFREHT